MAMTITEALAELKTIQKRIDKKREHIGGYLMRQDAFKDPLEKDGGSPTVIKRERQAIDDLDRRRVAIRLAIQAVNQRTAVTVEGETRMLADWLTWRKEVAPGAQQFLKSLRAGIDSMRKQAMAKGASVVSTATDAAKPADVIVNVDEGELARDAERIEMVLGGLDGQLSLKNATVLIEV